MTTEKTYVGILSQRGQGGMVLTDYPVEDRGKMNIRIPADRLNGAPFGMRVVCSVDDTSGSEWQGAVVEVLGDPARPDVAIEGILRHYNLPLDFPEEVKKQAETWGTDPDPDTVTALIRDGRTDLRDLPTLTIDGEDAKDLDDAISIRRLDNGGFRLWVHIADVAQYVTEDSPMDLEARSRGNSVYLVDRVIPMLPPRLSNGMCSLNPEKDRLAMTVVLDMDHNGSVQSGDIMESVIRSDARTSYKQIYAFLEEGALRDRFGNLEQEIFAMRDLAAILQRRLSERGMLGFEFPETVVELDSEGKPTDIYPYTLTFTNGIIEAFMIAANEYVAETFHKKHVPFVYRVHELPDEEKLKKFTNLAANMGVSFRHRGRAKPKDLAKALEQIQTMDTGAALSQLLLRSLAKARYAPENLGHYGLASTYYSHFTSPIRRYPDLFIHRVIKGWLSDRVKMRKWAADAKTVSDIASETERLAAQAERDTVQQKACEYMADRLGEEFDGAISGIIAGGFFVRLASTVEGMVPFRMLDDYLEYDEETLTARGVRSGKVLHIGNPVRVRVARVDTILRRIDFELLEEKPVPRPGRAGGKPRKKKKTGGAPAGGTASGSKNTKPAGKSGGTHRKSGKKSGKKRK